MTEQYLTQTESIKLSKNSKGYTWEIKVFLGHEENDKNRLERIEKLDNELKKKYGRDYEEEIEKLQKEINELHEKIEDLEGGKE